MKIYYHGTDQTHVDDILRNGFETGSLFTSDLDEAIKSGSYVFKIGIEYESPMWQFHTIMPTHKNRIISLTAYQKNELFVNSNVQHNQLHN